MIQLRHEVAVTLGYENHAAYILEVRYLRANIEFSHLIALSMKN
jgi:Zn-dependent oligopeptidase